MHIRGHTRQIKENVEQSGNTPLAVTKPKRWKSERLSPTSSVQLLHSVKRWAGFSDEWPWALPGLPDGDPRGTDGFLLWGKVWGYHFPWVQEGRHSTHFPSDQKLLRFPGAGHLCFLKTAVKLRTMQAPYAYPPSSLLLYCLIKWDLD